ncbi:MAG TPA: UDP-N-acetylmuramoyl-L-alanine--D-glutamate ligase [Chloroflexia bacterium]|nr:UDP-N-acetylmuramoyl-L-alanine--D-glutamate ligase [Chloroflexia bacterium]
MDSYIGKNILVMGLGVHGGGLGVARFMARNGANVRVTDLRTADRMQSSIDSLEAEGLHIEYTLGEHREADFEWADMVVKNPAVPRDSPWMALARRLGKPIEMEISIFLRLCPAPVVAVTGTKGKSTTATWAWEMLRHWRPDAVLAGNMRVSALEALPRINPDTPVVLELSSWQLEGLEEPGISPHIGAVTNLSPDHMDRYKGMEDYGAAKQLIFSNQRPARADWAVLNVDDSIVSQWSGHAPAGVAWFGVGDAAGRVPGVFFTGGALHWHTLESEQVLIAHREDLKVPGLHNLANAACAATMSILAGAPLDAVREGLRSFRGVADRLEYLATLRGVRFYNDTTSTTPASTQAALNALEGPIVLIAGGADKNLDFAALAPTVAERASAVILLEGTATDLMERQFRDAGANILGRYSNFEEAIRAAWEAAPDSGCVLLSPATASFGMFRNEFDRGEQFRAIVARLVENHTP